MVNTFLVERDFRQSAKWLSRAHLGKQRVEAMQIRNILLDLEFLSWYFDVDIPPRRASKDQIYQWSSQVSSFYHQLPWKFRHTPDGQRVAIPGDLSIYKPKDNEIYQVEDGIVYLSTKTGLHPHQVSEEEFLFPGERIVGDGLRNHPIVVLWHTYTDALGEYINAHIDEWVARGYNNTMVKYELPKKYDYPDWVNQPEFHRTMRARLREKEVAWLDEFRLGQRKVKPEVWYTTKDFFLSAGEDTGYLW